MLREKVKFLPENIKLRLADGSGEKEKEEHHDERVAEVQERAGRILDLKLSCEVVAAVDEEVDRRESARQETSPPPVVVLGTQVEITQQDRRLGARDDEDQEHQKQESEHVIHLVRPQRVQDEEQLDEDAA